MIRRILQTVVPLVAIIGALVLLPSTTQANAAPLNTGSRDLGRLPSKELTVASIFATGMPVAYQGVGYSYYYPSYPYAYSAYSYYYPGYYGPAYGGYYSYNLPVSLPYTAFYSPYTGYTYGAYYNPGYYVPGYTTYRPNYRWPRRRGWGW